MPELTNAQRTINEKEAVDNIHEYLESKGIKITKADIDRVLDAAHDLTRAALLEGKGVKVRDVGTLEVRPHAARSRKVPDTKNPGQFLTVNSPAGKHVVFVEAESLYNELQTAEQNEDNPLM